jgi:hypothetical protein
MADRLWWFQQVPPDVLRSRLYLHPVVLPCPFLAFDVDGHDTIARGINKKGTVVGNWKDGAGRRHGFRRNPSGTIDKFDFTSAKVGGKKVVNTVANGINDAGHIVGNFAIDEGNEEKNPQYGYRLRPFDEGSQPLPQDFEIIDIGGDPTLAKETTANTVINCHAMCINNQFHVAGRYFFNPPGFPPKDPEDVNARVQGFLLMGGDAKAATLGKTVEKISVDGKLTEVYGINSKDDLVGVAGWPSSYAFLQKEASTKPLPPFSKLVPTVTTTFSRGRGISSKRRVVGQYTTETNGNQNSPQNRPGHGFLWDVDLIGGGPVQIDVPIPQTGLVIWSGWPVRLGHSTPADSTYAHGISEDHFIVGEFKDATGIRAFILDPVLWELWLQSIGPAPMPMEPPIPVPWWQWWHQQLAGIAMARPVTDPAKRPNSTRSKRKSGKKSAGPRKSGKQ